ncbi:MAG: hypothetical protein D6693_09810 [Planctomycetota bacterium]|nr:MAG: hypothetical protein D6693_09810 [Planctomycetota bacterium]
MAFTMSGFVAGMAVGGGLVLAGLVLGGQAPALSEDASFNTITAQEIRLTDRLGRETYLTLGSSELGGHVALMNAAGAEVMVLGVSELQNPIIDEEAAAAPSEETEEQTPIYAGTIDLLTDSGTLLMRHGGTRAGGEITVRNILGRRVGRLAARATLDGRFQLLDQGGESVAEIVASTQGGLYLSMDRRGRILARLPQ